MIHVSRPTLYLHEGIARANAARMVATARQAGIPLRPHLKTPQSAAVAEIFRELGVTGGAVSSYRMAAYFQAHGWDDLLVAFPAHPGNLPEILALAAGGSIGVLLSHPGSAAALLPHLPPHVRLWMEVDTGYPRSGIRWDQAEELAALGRLLEAARPRGNWGLLTHAGHTYKARGKAGILDIHRESMARSVTAQQHLAAAGLHPRFFSGGDTPACSTATDFGPWTEMRPGNFLYYDLQQCQIGSCTEADIAIALAVPVVDVHPERNEAIVHGGGVYLAKDNLTDASGRIIWGRVCLPQGDAWGPPLPDVHLVSLSQEHAIVSGPESWIRSLTPGQTLFVLPAHSCMTADAVGALTGIGGRRYEMMDKR